MFQFHHITLRELLVARGLPVRVTYDHNYDVYHLNDDAGYEREVPFEHVDELIFSLGTIDASEESRDAALRIIQAHIDTASAHVASLSDGETTAFPTLDEVHKAFIEGANNAPPRADVSATDRAGLQAVLDLIKRRLGL
jgi:hypothetical protein